MPDSEISPEEKPPESARIQLVERLCVLLVDVNQKDAEVRNTITRSSTYSLNYIPVQRPQVIDTHLFCTPRNVSARSAWPLTNLYYCYPLNCLVPFPINGRVLGRWWGTNFGVPQRDNFVGIAKLLPLLSNLISRAIRTLNQTLFFMHYIVFTSVSILNLRQKLHVPQHRIFHGLMHLFIVTFGRLSYSEAPEWINREGRTELVSLTGELLACTNPFVNSETDIMKRHG